jgi:phosphate transport system permease protein
MKHRKLFESVTEKVLLACACFSILSVLFITVFIFQRGAPLFRTVRVQDFLFSTNWQPASDTAPGYGILSFIVGSLFVTGGALLFGVPIGIGCGIFLAEIATGRLAAFLLSSVELLAGIPSVVYGFFGGVVVCRLVREVFGGTGYNVLSASIVLAVMILPTFISITEASLRSVPREYREASFAIGSTHWQTITRVLVPAGRSGILAGIVLGVGRAVGETMAVLMVGGNAPIMPTGPLSKVRTLTMNIVTDMGYASGDHLTALFSTSMVLFVFIMLLNIVVTAISRRALQGKA